MSEPAQPELGALGYLRLVLLGAVIGIPAALLASRAPFLEPRWGVVRRRSG